MIGRLVSVAAVAWALAVTHVSAATVSFDLDESLTTGQPGDVVTFTGTIMNTGPATAFLNGTSFVFPFAIDDTPFFLNFPVSLAPGGSASGALFSVAIPLGTPNGLNAGVFSILGGDTLLASDVLATADFAVAVVPEPGTITMVVVAMLLFSSRLTLPAWVTAISRARDMTR